jgi:DNA-binding PadR family transcriptional regulator
VVSGRVRKVYTLTEKGREAFKVAVEAWMDVTHCLIESGRVAAIGGERTRGNICCN